MTTLTVYGDAKAGRFLGDPGPDWINVSMPATGPLQTALARSGRLLAGRETVPDHPRARRLFMLLQ